jgi:hypothetical protein
MQVSYSTALEQSSANKLASPKRKEESISPDFASVLTELSWDPASIRASLLRGPKETPLGNADDQ